jgi:catechol 2,3-dioxygenase-like lactoylglutathione lyase family enzyme
MLTNAPIIAVLPCVDLEGARDFYGDVLGLREAQMPVDLEEETSAIMYECGQGTRLLVYQRATPTQADHTAAGWMVDDLEAVVDGLIARGVTMEVYDMPGVTFDERGIARMGDRQAAWFTDPEGNILSINEMP